MRKRLLLLTLILFAALLMVQAASQAEANTPPITHNGSGLRYGGEVFWPFTEDNLWDPNMWQEDLLPLFQEQHLSFAPWGGVDWCAIQSEGDPADPDTWDWTLVDTVLRVFADSGLEPILPHVGTGDCEFTAETEIEDSGSYPPLEDRWDDWYRFVVALADRYDGTHPDPDNPGQTLPQVRYFELVAENDQPQFWGGTPEELYGFDADGNPITATVQVIPGLTLPKALLPIFYAGIHHDPGREAYVIAGSHTTIYALGSRLVERKQEALQVDGELSPADIQELLAYARSIYTYFEDHDTNHLVDSPNPRQFPDYEDLELWLEQTARYRTFIDPFFDANAYYDIVGLHNFLSYHAFEDYLAYVRQEMAEHGISDYSIWITELGHVDSDRACWLAIFCAPTQPDGQETEAEHAQSMEKKLVLAAHFGVEQITYSALIELPISPCVSTQAESPHPCVHMGFWTPYEVDGSPVVISDTIALEAADALAFASGIFNADFAYQSRRENLSPQARLYVFDGDDGVNHVAVGWCEGCGAGQAHNVDATLGISPGTPIAAYDYLGDLLGDPHSHTINFTESPVFITWESATPTPPPILVSIVMHNEEPPHYPDFVNDEPTFWQHRNALVQFADMLYANDVMFNYQSDWNFLMAAGMCDTGTPSTNGKNVVRYIKEHLGFEVDPHAHETQYNYADVAYLIEALGVTPSHTVGGMIVHPPESSILEQFWQPITGRRYPTYTWQAKITWGGGTRSHKNEEPLWASGVWKPKDKYHFLEHDDAAPLPNVGNYGGQWGNLDRLLQLQQDGELEDKIHTCTISVRQDDLVIPGFIQEFEQRIQARDAMGDIRWVGLAEVIDIWQTEYDSEPNILRYVTPQPRVYLPLIFKSVVTPITTPTPIATPSPTPIATPSPTPTLTLTPTPTLTLTPTPPVTTEPPTPAGYLVISYNANYLRGSPDNVQQATAQQFVPTLNRHLDLIDGLDGSATLTTGMAADYYFTGLAAEKLAEWSTETVARLLDSPYGLHYHGANRPPYPQLVDQVLGQDWEQDVATVRTYEADGVNPATGAHVGGITAFRNVFGQDPFATGRFFEASILAVNEEMGVKMAVGLGDNAGASRNDAWFLGVLNRSESLALGPAPLVDAALNDQGEEYLAQVRAQLTSLTDPVPIVAFLIHDHDFFKHPPADQEKIWALYEQVLELTQDLGFRSVTLHDVYALAENGPAPTLAQDELLQAAQSLVQTMEETGYPPEYVAVGQVANLSYSLAEVFEGLARALATYHETGSLPTSVDTHDLLGPTVVFHSSVTTATVPADDVLDAAVAISTAITDRLPSQISVGEQSVDPAEFLYLMAQEYAAIAQGGPAPVTLRSISALPLATTQNFRADPLTKLQFWTYKPAIFTVG